MGSRRAIEPMSPAQAASAFAEDDLAPTCPECGAGIRPGQEWCSLCMHVLREPEPEPEPEPVALPQPALTPAVQAPAADPQAADVQAADVQAAVGAAAEGPTPEVRAQVEAAADALLEQLAVESSHDRLNVPDYLNSKARIAVFVTVAMSVLSGLGLAALAVLGWILG